MATAFPAGKDAFLNPSPLDALNRPGYEHDLQHANVNDAVRALEDKVGINGSTDPTSLDARVRATPGIFLGRTLLDNPTATNFSFSAVAWVQPTNWAAVACIVPLSGNVQVLLDGPFTPEANYGMHVGVALTSVAAANVQAYMALRPPTDQSRKRASLRVTGLTPGASVVLIPVVKNNHSSYTSYVYYGGPAPDPNANQAQTYYGPAIFEVRSD